MNTINEIKEMLDKVNEELENLRAENKELKLRLAKYEAIAENNTDISIEMSSTLSKEELYELGESIINHTAKDEVQAISQLMYCWANNEKASKVPGNVTKMVITSKSLSEKNLEIICKFIVSTIKERYTSKLGKPIEMPHKYRTVIYCLLDKGNLPNEWYETLLDITFEHSRSYKLGFFVTFFEKSSRYNVVNSNIEKKS